MMETINMMERSYKRALLYAQEDIDEKLGRKDEIIEKAERSELYLVLDGIKITLNEI